MKRNFQISTLLILLATFLIAGCKSTPSTTAHRGADWVKLGERLVDFKADRDVIPVTASEGKFSAIRLMVLRAPVFLNAVTVTYGNGATHRFAVNKRIAPGNATRAAILPGGARIIRKVTFTYRTAPRATKKALIVLRGKH